MFEQSSSIAKLTGALVQVQATVEGAVKGRSNPAFKSKYADLSSVWDACREQLVSNGLTVVQFPGEMIDNRMTLTTQLSHESGEWMRSTLSIPLTKVDAQGYGSAVTYARRYALAAVVGVCPEDDDGNAASQRGGQQQRQEQPSVITEDQRNVLLTLAQQSGADMK
ncbi:MAG: single-stranded DNA-binding protein, partial [Oxalobacteraceae bacterium]